MSRHPTKLRKRNIKRRAKRSANRKSNEELASHAVWCEAALKVIHTTTTGWRFTQPTLTEAEVKHGQSLAESK